MIKGAAKEKQGKGFGDIRVFSQQKEDRNAQRSRVQDEEINGSLVDNADSEGIIIVIT